MRVTFVLPGRASKPVGGYVVTYQYANHLVERGHQVTVIYPRRWLSGGRPLGEVKSVMAYVLQGLARRRQHSREWFDLDQRVVEMTVSKPAAGEIPLSDVVVATSWETATHVANLPLTHGAKAYLIQHYETWAGPGHLVDATWKLPLHKVVISRWLQQVADRLGVSAQTTYIPVGIDTSVYSVLRPIETRRQPMVAMMYHREPWKGIRDGLQALELAKQRVPDLTATLFGGFRPPRHLPPWIRYIERPTREKLVSLYNSAAVFLHTSHSEGWGLPAAEAMACGCALVAAANEGVQEFAVNDQTALLAPIGNPAALAEQLVVMLSEDQLRVRIARAGTHAIGAFTWDQSTDRFERVLRTLAADRTAAVESPVKRA